MLIIKAGEIRQRVHSSKWAKFAPKYHICMAVLSLVAIAITVYSLIRGEKVFENPALYWGDFIIVIIFNIDYWGGMFLSLDRKQYFKTHLFDLLSIIPINQGLMLFRSVRLLKFLKIMKIFQFIKMTAFINILNKNMKKFLRINGFIYALAFTLGIILMGSILIYKVEFGKTIKTYWDALWWTFVTTTTVGYGDISPQTFTGRMVAVVLMIVGIGFISMLTGSITTYFVNKIEEERSVHKQSIIVDKIISDLDGKDLDLSDLTDEQYAQVIMFIKFMKQQNSGDKVI